MRPRCSNPPCENTARYDSGFCGICDIVHNSGNGKRAHVRSSWDNYFLEIAEAIALRSTCLRVPEGVGCVIVRDNRILSGGYAGSLPGDAHCSDEGIGCLIDEKTGGCIRTVHAETNAIVQAAKHGVSLERSILYSTMSPCWDCFKALAASGVWTMIYSTEYRIVEMQRSVALNRGIDFTHVGTRRYVGGGKYEEISQ